jgi:hypothetical protein
MARARARDEEKEQGEKEMGTKQLKREDGGREAIPEEEVEGSAL